MEIIQINPRLPNEEEKELGLSLLPRNTDDCQYTGANNLENSVCSSQKV